MCWAYSITTQRFPEQRIRLMWIGYLHAIDLHKNEVIQFFCSDSSFKLRDHFADCGCFTRAWDAGDVDAGARTVGDGGFEMGVDGREGFFAARQRSRDCGDVETGSSDLKG